MYGGSPCTPPTAVPNLFHVIKDTFGNKNPVGSKKFYTPPALGGSNSKWRPELVGGHTNFFSMGDNIKILFSSMGFMATGNATKLF